MAQRNGVPRRGDDGRCPLGDRGENFTDKYRIPIPTPLPLSGSHLHLSGSYLCNLFFSCPKGTRVSHPLHSLRSLRGTPFRCTTYALPRPVTALPLTGDSVAAPLFRRVTAQRFTASRFDSVASARDHPGRRPRPREKNTLTHDQHRTPKP